MVEASWTAIECLEKSESEDVVTTRMATTMSMSNDEHDCNISTGVQQQVVSCFGSLDTISIYVLW